MESLGGRDCRFWTPLVAIKYMENGGIGYTGSLVEDNLDINLVSSSYILLAVHDLSILKNYHLDKVTPIRHQTTIILYHQFQHSLQLLGGCPPNGKWFQQVCKMYCNMTNIL